MPLDPVAQKLIELVKSLNEPPLGALPLEQARQRMYRAIRLSGEPEEVAKVENRKIPGPAGEIPVRVYTPTGKGPFPVLVYYHGGGWVVCDLETHDPICRSMAHEAACIVVSVDYRLAPEAKFPAAVEDSYAALEWVAAHAPEINGDSTKIAVGGDSAGGNLAAVVSLLARDRQGPALVFQLLIYPSVASDHDFPSIQENGKGYMLEITDMEWFASQYIPDGTDLKDPRLSPYWAESHRDLPPALVITAEFDPLRDEGEAYAQKLKEAGTPAQVLRYDGMIHGFYGMTGRMAQAREAIATSATALRQAFE